MENCADLEIYKNKTLVYYTPREEKLNFISHFVGSIFGVTGMLTLIFISSDFFDILSSLFFGFGVILTYTNSAIYHGLKNLNWKTIWRKIDHSSVGFIIVSCGAPMLLSMTRQIFDYTAFTICLILCFVNMALCIIDLRKFSKVALILDFVSAIIIICAYFVNLPIMPTICRVYFISGAVLCLAGSFFFGRKKEFLHAVFHILMLVGTMSFFMASYYLMSV